MKTDNPLLSTLALALLIAAANNTTHAQTWDTFLPRPDTSEAAGTQVLIDPFSADPANPAVFIGSQAGKILRMEPLGATTYETTGEHDVMGAIFRMGFNPADSSAYAIGNRPLVTTPPYPRTNPNVWTVRKSSYDPDFQTWGAWADADLFQMSAKDTSTAYGFAADAAGNLYACGTATLKGLPHWIVRRKLAGGSWATIADLAPKGSATAYGACFFPGNLTLPPALFVVGTLSGKWTVQRLQNGSWTTVDSAPLSGSANSITVDSNGNLFVVGTRSGAVSDFGYGWVIRKSTSGGAPGSWLTVLDVSEGYTSSARHVAVDASGDLWVTGHTGSTMDIQTSANRWTVIRNSPGQSWSDSWNTRQHPFDGLSSNSGARGIATDAYGNVFVTGGVTDLTDGFTAAWPGPRIVVQRLVP